MRRFVEERGHELVVTSDKDGAESEFERRLPDAEIVISQPFWPAYLTAERIAKAPKLIALTAGIGSDHVDLQAAMDNGITVTEVTYCNSISVAEHVVMLILVLVRDLPAPTRRRGGGTLRTACRVPTTSRACRSAPSAQDIGSAVLRRLKPFDVGLHYMDRHRLPAEVEEELGVSFHSTSTRSSRSATW